MQSMVPRVVLRTGLSTFFWTTYGLLSKEICLYFIYSTTTITEIEG